MSEKTEEGRMGPGGQRWPRRRVFRWALGLVPVVAAGGWASFKWLGQRERSVEEGGEGPEDGWEVEGGRVLKGGPTGKTQSKEEWAALLTRQAATYCFLGYASASPKLNLALKAVPSHAPARLMYACWYMHKGNWELARSLLSDASVRDTLETRFLLELAERRTRAPDWIQAFFETWKALGRPDFSKSTLLPEPLEWNHVMLETYTRSPEDEAWRLPMAVLNPAFAEHERQWVLEQVRACSSVPLLMALHEHLSALEEQDPPRPFLLPAVQERLGQLVGPSPKTLQLALVFFLAGSPPTVPFTRRDLEALEKIVALREWKQPSSESFYREMRERVDVLYAPGHHAWALATFAQGVSLGSSLLQRARSSKAHLTEDEQRWMGRLLWEVGARLREQPSRLELETGLRLQMFGSELTQHSPSRSDCIALWGKLGQWEETVKQAAFYRWPLAPLHEESCEPRARDELAWMRSFAG
jgi:hypothetical protein